MNTVTIKYYAMGTERSREVPEDEFDKILSLAISALGRMDDRSPMEERAFSTALRLESR